MNSETANASAARMATPFTFGLDANKWKQTVEGDYVPTPEQKRPGKKPARPDEALPRVQIIILKVLFV